MSSSLPFKTFCHAIAQALCADGIPYDANRVQRGVRATLQAMGLERNAPLPAPAQLIEPFLQHWVPLLEHELGLEVVQSAGQAGFRDMPTLNARLAQLRQGAPGREVRMELDLPSFCEGLSQAFAADAVELSGSWLEASWLRLAGQGAQDGAREEGGRWKLELRWLAARYPVWRVQLGQALGVAGGALQAWPHVHAKLAQLEQVMRSQHLLDAAPAREDDGLIGRALSAAAAGEPAAQVNARMHRARYGLRVVH